MFSSKKDLEVAWFFIPLLLVIVLVLYLNGFRVIFPQKLFDSLVVFLKSLNFNLLTTILLDTIIFLIFKGLVSLLQKLLKVKLTSS